MQAGLTLGLDVHDLKAKLLPISIDKDETNEHSLEEVILKIVKKGTELFKIDKTYSLADIELVKGYDKAGYGVVTSNEHIAIKELATKEGILLDPVYTGRAFYGMLDFLENKKLPKGATVLFWHTGGLPAIFKYAKDLL